MASRSAARYESFELLVDVRRESGYPLIITRSPAGDARAVSALDPADDELVDALEAIADRSSDREFLSDVGAYLFDQLFVGDVGALYRESLALTRGRGEMLRVRLRIEAPELAALPWEYLYDPREESALALAPESVLVRYIPLRLPARPTAVAPPLRLLVLLADPVDAPALDIGRERELIASALDPLVTSGRIEIQVVDEPTVESVTDALRTLQPHVLHFVGHGRHDESGSSLLLVDDAGHARSVGERALREMLAFSRETRLAVLNACETGQLSTTQPLVGLAPRLLQRRLSAVVAMQRAIPDRSALVFTREFYRTLAQGEPLEAAISAARRGIVLEAGEDSADWGIPVLFLRARDGRLFEVEKERPESLVPPPPAPASPPRAEALIGRDDALTRHAAELEDEGLTVIVGLPGSGKSALAAELASSAAPPERLFWHTLQPGEGSAPLIWSLAAFLAYHGEEELWQSLNRSQLEQMPAEILIDLLVQQLQGRNLLLVFDALENLREEPLITRMIARLRGERQRGEVSLILTAREVPGFVPVASESALPGLDLDATEQLISRAGLTLTPAQLERLHRKSAGNPRLIQLAINGLAATDEPDRLLDRLTESDDVERFLLRAVDDGLGEMEREILCAAAVLMGYGGSEDAIETLMDRGRLRRSLRDLCDRFVLQSVVGSGPRHYVEHSMIRPFYYNLLGRRERRLLHRVAAEYYVEEEPDVPRAALHYELAEEREQALSYLERAGDAAARVSAQREALDFYERALQQVVALEQREGARRRADHSRLLVRVAGARMRLGDYPVAKERALDALALAREGNELQSEADSLRLLGNLSFFEGAFDQADAHYTRALELYRSTGDRLGEARALANLGGVADEQGDPQRAVVLHREALALFESIGDATGISISRNYLAITAADSGDFEGARREYERALEVANTEGNRRRQAQFQDYLGALATVTGDYARAEQLGQAAVTLAREIENPQVESDARLNLGVALLARGEFDRALEEFERVYEASRELGDTIGEALAHIALAATRQQQGRTRTAGVHAEQARSQAVALEVPRIATDAGMVLASLALDAGRLETAERHLEKALATYRDLGDRLYEHNTLIELGYLALERGRLDSARDHFDAVLAFATETGNRRTMGSALVATAHHIAREGEPERAVRWIASALASAHTDAWERARATRLLDALRNELDSGRVDAALEAAGEESMDELAATRLGRG